MNNENDSRNISLDDTKVSHSMAETEKTEMNSLIEEYERINDLFQDETSE